MDLYKKLRNHYTLFYTYCRMKATKQFIKQHVRGGGTILDLGSRQGIFNGVFRDIKFSKIVAIDLDKKALQLNDAEQKLILDLEEGLPFPDEFFECAFCAEVIEHLEKRKRLLGEVFRVLKKSGYLVLTTPNKSSLIAKFDKLIGRFIENGYWNGHDFNHRYVYAFKEINNLLNDVGFKIITCESFYLFYGLPIRTKGTLGMCAWVVARKP